ncbi:MAG: acylneuraminate cytidylyltransferase family protein [Planctomycetes bacterium]|nr:acylneuraminate cytidylyltransferase family protein [Planctomycetota bacterium]
MLHGKRILVVVPARGGSKGVPLKNIRPLAGRPLIAHTAELVRKLAYVDRAVVSTDHSRIAAFATRSGLDVPFTRPPELSGDRVGDFPVLEHALGEMEAQDEVQYDVVVMLQPTCPQRKPEHVTRTVAMVAQEEWDAAWTVSRTDLKYHPLKQLCLSANGALSLFDPRGSGVIARQQLEPTYTRNGAAYAVKRCCLKDQQTLMGENCTAVVVDDPLVSIDTLDDFALVEPGLAATGAVTYA